jgi:hypothetical protein
MPTYTFTRSAIVLEVFAVDALTEDAAREALNNGPKPTRTEWTDWYTDDYELDDARDDSTPEEV